MNLFSYIKTKVPILDVISEYSTLKKAGLYWKGQCPFHSERTASFTVSPHKEIFYCFGCHKGGDVITFVAEIERCNPLQAAKHLVDRYGIELPTALSFGSQNKENKKHYYDMCEHITTWCHEQLLKSKDALSYLADRGINKESILLYHLGYFPGGLARMKTFTTYMASHNVLVEDLLDIHFISKTKNILFSPFEERIIFPIYDIFGQPCGFGGRIFKATDNRPKYYNSHENEYFAKGHLLFGLNVAKKDIQKKEQLFLVEGYMDAITMVQYEFKNTVATLGTACTLDHLQLLARYAQELIVVYDGDTAGTNAILRIAELAWQANLDLKVLNLPKNEDPASYLTKGMDLRPLINECKEIFTFFIATLGSGFASKPLNEKLQLTRKIIEVLGRIQDPLKQDILLEQAHKTLNIPLASLKRELLTHTEHPKATRQSPAPDTSKTEPKSLTRAISPLEKAIFSCIMHNMQLLTDQNGDFLITYLPTPLCDILSKLKKEKDQKTDLGFIQFFEYLTPEEQQIVSKLMLETPEGIQSGYFEQLFTQLQKNHWKVMVNSIKEKIQKAKESGDDEKVAQLMQDFVTLKKQILSKNQ